MHEIHEQIAEREANFQELIQNAPDAIIVIDDEKVKLLCGTRESEKIFGWKADEVKGTPP